MSRGTRVLRHHQGAVHEDGLSTYSPWSRLGQFGGRDANLIAEQNPSLKDDCSDMKVGNAYCVEAWTPESPPPKPTWSTITYYPTSTATDSQSTTSAPTTTSASMAVTSSTVVVPSSTPEPKETDGHKTQEGIVPNCMLFLPGCPTISFLPLLT